MTLRLLTALILTLTFVGCADQFDSISESGSQESSDAILRGNIADTNDAIAKSVFFLRINHTFTEDRQSWSVNNCTATPISKRIIVTAAHCIPKDKPDMEMRVEIVTPDGPRHSLKLIDYIQHKEYTKTPTGSHNDLALVLLDEELPSYLGKRALLPMTGTTNFLEKLLIAGFGTEDEFQQTPGRNRRLKYAFTNALNYKTSAPAFAIDNSGEGSICHGDSGGPAFIRLGANFILVGVASSVDSAPGLDTKCNDQATYTNVSYYLDWIMQQSEVLMLRNDKNPTSGVGLFGIEK